MIQFRVTSLRSKIQTMIKNIGLFDLLSLLIVWIILSGNTYNSDAEVYYKIYTGYYGNVHEIGFTYLCNFFFTRGISYQTFRILIYSFSILSYVIYIGNINGSYKRTMFLYFIYPMILDGIQVRTVLAYAIILLGLLFLYRGRIKNIVIFIMFVLLATTFHFSAIFYLSLVLSQINMNKTQFKNAVIIISVILLGLFYIAPRFLSVFLSTDNAKMASNITQHAGVGVLIPIVLHLLIFSIFSIYYKEQGHKSKLIQTQYRINICMLLLIPLYAYTMTFQRLLRIIIFSNNTFIFAKSSNRKNNTVTIPQILTVFLMIVFCLYQIVTRGLIRDFAYNNIFY